MDRPLLHIVWGLFLGCCLAPGAHAEPPIRVGVLENVGTHDPGAPTPPPQVRLAFEYRDHSWTAFTDDYPPTVEWNVVFDGRRIGTIVSQAPTIPVHGSGEAGVENISTAPEKIPRIKQGAADFSSTLGDSLSRPLVLVSAPHFSDPESWKPTTLSAAEKQLALQNFHVKVPSIQQCDELEQQASPPRQTHYSDSQVSVVKAYRSKQGVVLAGLLLNIKISTCQFFDDPDFYSYWFVLNGASARFLDTQMMPLDAADLTGSGHSVWIFQTSRGEDEDGYELFYDDFARHAGFSWHYH